MGKISLKKSEVDQKNLSLIKKLQNKLHELVDSDKLTMAGKIYLMASYISIITFKILIALSICKTLITIVAGIINYSTKGYPFFGATLITAIVFTISFIFVLAISCVECTSAGDGDSILTED